MVGVFHSISQLVSKTLPLIKHHTNFPSTSHIITPQTLLTWTCTTVGPEPLTDIQKVAGASI